MNDEFPTTQFLDTPLAEHTAQQFMIEQALARMSKAVLVRVTKVTTKGDVAAVGNVAVTPLVKMQDALGNVHAHGAMNNLPYFRMQGGADKAIIMDPKEGDIGIAIFADRDQSAAIKNHQGWDGKKSAKDSQAPPGSFRTHDMADGMFFGCFLGGKPKSYIQFMDDGTLVFSPDEGVTTATVKKGIITFTPDSGATKAIVEPAKLSLLTSGQSVFVRPGRVDLGALDAPNAVVTDAGPSTKVFAVI